MLGQSYDLKGRWFITADTMGIWGSKKRHVGFMLFLDCLKSYTIHRRVCVGGAIHTTVEPCLAFIKRNIALGSQIGEMYRQDRWEYPLEVIFDDMLEITRMIIFAALYATVSEKTDL